MNEQKLFCILQTRNHNKLDFEFWISYYEKFIKCDKIIIVDDKSTIDIKNIISNFSNIIYIKRESINLSKMTGNNTQCKVVNYCLEKFNVKKNDIVIIPDDDEFWWYDYKKYTSFKEIANSYFNKFSNAKSILVPWTMMFSNDYLVKRDKNFKDTFKYNIKYDFIEHKPLVLYSGKLTTSFHNFYEMSRCKSLTNIDEKINFKSKYEKNLDLRCFHFRYTTQVEYRMKISSTISNPNKKRREYLNTFCDVFKMLKSKGLEFDDTLEKTSIDFCL